MTNILNAFKDQYEETKPEEYTLTEYLELCKIDKMAYASPAERWLAAVGEPEIVNTSTNSRLARIYGNRILRRYKPFENFYGIEEVIENIVNYFRHNAQGLEESKQLLYLVGPVGSSKSSLAERIKELMEVYPIYVLTAKVNGKDVYSPYLCSPLSLFNTPKMQRLLEKEYGIDQRYTSGVIGPWEAKRIKEFNGDINKFKVTKIYPSRMNQLAIANAEPGDPNTQDVSTLTGKIDIRKLEDHAQNDPDAYLFSGGLNKSNQGILDFREMFKAPIKMLNPLLFAVQEHNYEGTENFGSIPYNGIIVSHCFSEDTELLTQNGWKYHNEIEVGDFVATMNKDSGIMEYQPTLRKFEQDYSGPMYHFKSNSADHLVTPNHKMVYHTQYTNDWKFCTADEFGETGKIIPVSAKNNLPDCPVSDNWLKLMVWIVADGSLEGKKIRFHLKKNRKIERLTALLNDMGIEFTKNTYNNGETWNIRIENNLSYNKVQQTLDMSLSNRLEFSKEIPDFYNELSARQARLVLEEYSHTDGSRDFETHCQLSSNNINTINKLQHLAVSSGNKTSLSSHIKSGYSTQYFLSIIWDITETRSDYIKELTHYTGKIFCFETENHTLVARRNGSVIITGNSNETEWGTFRNNKSNEAFLDRVLTVKVPYCLRVDEEVNIYEKYINGSDLKNAICAPGTKEILAQFAVMSRIHSPKNSSIYSKMEVYNGKNMKITDTQAKTAQEYREDPENRDEGFHGFSTRSAFKILSKTFNADPEEVAADPVHLLYILEQEIKKSDLPMEVETMYVDYINSHLKKKYEEMLDHEIRTAYLESYGEYGQSLMDRYLVFAESWIDENDYFDAETGLRLDKNGIDQELSKIEKPANISNPKDFRSEVVRYCTKYQKNNNGKNPPWTSYERLKTVIEKKMFSATSELIPVISFGAKSSEDDLKKHNDFVSRMVAKGYSRKQCRFLVDWYMKTSMSNKV